MRRPVNRGGHVDNARSEPTSLGPGDLRAANGERDYSKAAAAPSFRQRVGALRLCVDSYLGLCYGTFYSS
jgi:hypothetical protein